MKSIYLVVILLFIDISTILFIRKKYHRYSLRLAIQHLLSIVVLFTASYWMIGSGKIVASLFFIAILTFFSVNQIIMGYTFMDYFHRYNILEVFLIILGIIFCISIMPNLLIAVICAGILYLMLGIISYYVYDFRGTELELWDIYSVSTAKTVLKKYKIRLNDIVFIGSLTELLHICIMILLLKDSADLQASIYVRVITFFFVLCVSYLLIFTNFLKNVGITYTAIQNSKGVIGNLLLQLIDSLKGRNDKNKELRNLSELEKYSDIEVSVKKDIYKYPNILVIMNESFADLRIFGDNILYENCYKKIDKLVENGMKSGKVYTSVYGGNTAFSEFEFLTGSSSRFYSGCPYAAHIIRKENICNTFITHMKHQGYTTIATHPYIRGNWRRPIVYSSFGFDKQFYIEDFEPLVKLRGYASDKSYYSKLIEIYKRKPKEKKYFSFNITIQNHGAYMKPEGIEMEKLYEDMEDVNVYLNLIRESTEAFEELINFFDEFSEPTAILFFGDHHPKLCDEFYQKVYGRDRKNLNDEEKATLYMTPWYIWTNYECAEVAGKRMSLNFLFEYFLQTIGVPRNSYGLYLDGLRKDFPVITKQYIMSGKAGFLQGDNPEKIMAYENIARGYLYDKKSVF